MKDLQVSYGRFYDQYKKLMDDNGWIVSIANENEPSEEIKAEIELEFEGFAEVGNYKWRPTK